LAERFRRVNIQRWRRDEVENQALPSPLIRTLFNQITVNAPLLIVTVGPTNVSIAPLPF
jgi:hypothetical protein